MLLPILLSSYYIATHKYYTKEKNENKFRKEAVMALNLGDKNWLTKAQFKSEFNLGESTYQTRMRKMTAGDSNFKHGYAKVSNKEVYINREVYNAWRSAEAEKNIFWVDY